ncbi:hypothetical protein CQA01_37540 [Cyclobacterium qasimii]|uniref:Carbohydrate-binding domain-containing protein n=2 Tax=Cyclobacterium qasimii TaxID=1350429 RepID=A0A512CGP3_9BACT|nr:hypothetical protein CQA01_37540 [Cyclobacterium qasimii]
MKLIVSFFIVIFGLIQGPNPKAMKESKPSTSGYIVKSVDKPISIDGNWDKPEWQEVEAASIALHMGPEPEKFIPKTQVKLRYDKDNIYGIFKVEDKYVRCVVQEVNGNVSSDSCVEFFFAPDTNSPLEYFNLEINCSGVPLFHYVTVPRKEFKKLKPEEIEQVEIAHTMPDKVDPEITEPVTWFIEFRVPLALLKEYREITTPAPGVTWKANFYKVAAKSSNPHYFTWNEVINPHPDFHLPKYFGKITFQ